MTWDVYLALCRAGIALAGIWLVALIATVVAAVWRERA